MAEDDIRRRLELEAEAEAEAELAMDDEFSLDVPAEVAYQVPALSTTPRSLGLVGDTASGFLKGVQNIAGLASLSKWASLAQGINPFQEGGPRYANLLVDKIRGTNTAQPDIGESVGKALDFLPNMEQRTGELIDVGTKLKNTTDIGKGSFAHTFASYLPFAAFGPENLAKNAIETGVLATSAATGQRLGGDTGEAIGALLPGAIKGGVNLLRNSEGELGKPLGEAFQSSADRQRLRVIAGTSRGEAPYAIDMFRGKPGDPGWLKSENELALNTIATKDDFFAAGLSNSRSLTTKARTRIDEITQEINTVIKKADDQIRDSGAILSIPQEELAKQKNAIINSFSRQKHKAEAEGILDEYVPRIEKARSLEELQALKREVYGATKWEGSPEIEPVTNATMKKLGGAIKSMINAAYEQTVGKSLKLKEGEVFGSGAKTNTRLPGTQQQIAKGVPVGAPVGENQLQALNDLDSAYLHIAPELEGMIARADRTTLVDKAISPFSSPRGNAAAMGLGTAGYAVAGVPGAVAAPAAYGVTRTAPIQMGLARAKEKFGHLAPDFPDLTQKAPRNLQTLAAAAAGPFGKALAPPPSADFFDSTGQGFRKGVAVPQMLAPPQPYANGLPRDTDQWTLPTLQHFIQTIGPDPVKGPIGIGMAQKFQEAVRAGDRKKGERIVADMAKLFPQAFEPGRGINGKLFHPDDQKVYMDELETAHRKGLIDSSFLAKQRQSFLDQNDAQILPVEPAVVKSQSRLPDEHRIPLLRGVANEPREYAY